MAVNELITLLRALRDGAGTLADVGRARVLLAEAGIPDELASVLDEEPSAAAAGLLAVLGYDDLGLADAVHLEAGAYPEADDVDVTAGVLAEIGEDMSVADAVLMELGSELPVADAVRAEAGRIEIADAVLRTLGLPERVLPVAEAVRDEAGTVDVAKRALADLGDALPVDEAVRAEAGTIDVADAVMAAIARSNEGRDAWISAMLDGELPADARRDAARRIADDAGAGLTMTAFAETGRELRAAVLGEAGPPPAMWDAVARRIGIADPEAVPGYEGATVAEAVRAEAGAVDVADAVMARVRKAAIAPVDVDEVAPEPVNRGWTWGALALAAVALIVVFAQIVSGSSRMMPLDPVAQGTPDPEAMMHFASADEIQIDDLNYADDANVQVIQGDEDDAPLIIVVDEGTTL